MFGNKKATKKNFYEYVIKNDDGFEKYLPILSNELYDRFISERTKKTLGIKQLYVNGVASTINLNEKATDLDTVIAHNELTVLLNKTLSYANLFKDKAHSNYHQFVDKLVDKNTKAGEAKKKPIILSFDDLIKGIEEQAIEEHTVYTDEAIANGNISRVSNEILDCKLSLLLLDIRACLLAVTFGMQINSNKRKIPR